MQSFTTAVVVVDSLKDSKELTLNYLFHFDVYSSMISTLILFINAFHPCVCFLTFHLQTH